jgi:hypothetical protein
MHYRPRTKITDLIADNLLPLNDSFQGIRRYWEINVTLQLIPGDVTIEYKGDVRVKKGALTGEYKRAVTAEYKRAVAGEYNRLHNRGRAALQGPRQGTCSEFGLQPL